MQGWRGCDANDAGNATLEKPSIVLASAQRAPRVFKANIQLAISCCEKKHSLNLAQTAVRWKSDRYEPTTSCSHPHCPLAPEPGLKVRFSATHHQPSAHVLTASKYNQPLYKADHNFIDSPVTFKAGFMCIHEPKLNGRKQ